MDTTLATLTASVSGTGTIDISDSADGLSVTSATTNNGSVALNATAGDLTVGTSVTAGGTANATLTTTASGNVILTGTTTAAGDQVTITSVAKINGAGFVTASVVDLNGATGLGDSTALQLAASTLTADSSTSGNIDLNNTLAGAVTVSSLTTLLGSVRFDQSGGGTVTAGTVSATTSAMLESPSSTEPLVVAPEIIPPTPAGAAPTTAGPLAPATNQVVLPVAGTPSPVLLSPAAEGEDWLDDLAADVQAAQPDELATDAIFQELGKI